MKVKINKSPLHQITSFIILAVLFLSFLNIFRPNEDIIINNFLGDWIGEFNGLTAVLNIKANKDCTLSFMSKDLKTVIKPFGKCEIDFTKNPYPMKITSSQNESKVYYTILRKIDNRTISMAKFSETWRLRPVAFDEQSLRFQKEEI